MVDRELTTHEWCARTGGALTRRQKVALLVPITKMLGQMAAGTARLAAGRRAPGASLPIAPGSGLVEAALEEARDQGPDLEGHGLRTWLFGGALAALDGVPLDAEAFCVTAIVHDAGAATTVDREDFTVRSAEVAVRSFARAGVALDPDREREVRDGIVAHATPGVTVEQSAIGAYVQAGAMLDLAGLRLADLPRATVREVHDLHPPGTMKQTILRLINEEARAVPDGRFALARRTGLAVSVRLSPTLRG